MYGRLFALGCANGAYACACAAVQTLVSVDYILAVTFGDAVGGTCVSACATADTIIRNLVCHLEKPPY